MTIVKLRRATYVGHINLSQTIGGYFEGTCPRANPDCPNHFKISITLRDDLIGFEKVINADHF